MAKINGAPVVSIDNTINNTFTIDGYIQDKRRIDNENRVIEKKAKGKWKEYIVKKKFINKKTGKVSITQYKKSYLSIEDKDDCDWNNPYSPYRRKVLAEREAKKNKENKLKVVCS